jgi:hypothetical protein
VSLSIQKMSFMGSKAVHMSPAQLLFMIGPYSLDVPCIIHLFSSVIVAVTVPGAGVYRERKEYYRSRICASKVAAQHSSPLF